VKVVLFCGGRGLRLKGGGAVPKPMVQIGGRPLLWHILRYYNHFGHNRFVICVGHQAEVIQEYFRNPDACPDCTIEFVDTPLDASIGERFSAVRDRFAKDEIFLANYGDTVTDVPLPTLIDYHAASGKVASLLAVRPNYTFNVVTWAKGHVTEFQDIAQTGIWINGGYFVLRGDVFDYIEAGEDLPEMFQRLIDAAELVAYAYEGFWAPMDTLKDKQRLEALVASGGGVFPVWETPIPAATSG
jgi:glucose-1-phosphate cytidylyltransferase